MELQFLEQILAKLETFLKQATKQTDAFTCIQHVDCLYIKANE